MSDKVVSNPKLKRPADLNYARDPLTLFCLLSVLFGFGGFLVWSIATPLAQGVTASGTLVVKDRRYIVQHLEGGIIQKISIEEGQSVREGDLLMIISDAEATSRLEQILSEQRVLSAKIDRFDTQLSDVVKINFSRLDALDLPQEIKAGLMKIEVQVFESEAAEFVGKKELMEARIQRLFAEDRALRTRQTGKRREIETLQSELELQQKAMNERMGNVSRINDIMRMIAIAETELANLLGQQNVTERSIEEARLELRQIELSYRAQNFANRAEALSTLTKIEEELLALTDRIDRQTLLAPTNGVVIDLKYSKIGAVVSPGDEVLGLVPSEKIYLVDARFQPQDRDDLVEGRQVDLRFSTLNPINPPELTGTLKRIAADVTTSDPQRGYYYTAEIELTLGTGALAAYEISPGIPVEIFFAKDIKRTPLSYLLEPITEMLRLGMR